MSKRAEGKVVVITGGSSGIGEGIAERFAEEGAHVVIFGRRQEALEKAKKIIGHDILTIQGDIRNSDDIKKLYRETQSYFGKIDTLISCAGVSTRLHIRDVREEDFDYMSDINYRGLYFTVKYALPFFNKNSSIVLIASIAAHATVKGHSVYSSNKAAVAKLAQNLSFDLADDSIRVNAISPGYILTPIFDPRIEAEPDYLQSRAEYIPLKRIGKPEDIASAALFLASDEASYITGADLVIDGGYTASYPLPD